MSHPTLKSLQAEIEALREQLAALAGVAPKVEAVKAAPAPAPEPVPEEIPEDVILAISAAIAAYLGKRAHIRTIRLIGSTAWAQQGRVSIQASHRLNVQHHHHR